MTLWQVTPLTRPNQVGRIVQEFRSQRCDRKLCLVLNGEGLAARVDSNVDLVLKSERGKWKALNVALEALPGQVLAIRDDDDFSRPSDLAECFEAFKATGAEIVSRLRHWVILDGVPWLFAEDEAECWGKPGVWGGSLLFRNTPDVPTFPEEHVTESQSWARKMVQLGARIWRPSIRNQVHVRCSFEGMWAAGPLEVRRTLGFKKRARKYFDDGSFEWVDSPTLPEVAEEKFAERQVA